MTASAISEPLKPLTQRQYEVNDLLGGPQRHTKLVGGARSGKTVLLVRAIIVRALKAQGTRHVILRLHAQHAHESIWLDTLPWVQENLFPGVKFKQREGQFVELPNKSQIWVGGLDDKERVDKILGREFITILFNECSQISYASVMTALTRLAQTSDVIMQRAYYDLNPVTTGYWTYKLFEQKRDPISGAPLTDPHNYAFAYMNPEDNRANLSDEFIASFQNAPDRYRQRFYEGKYTSELPGQLWKPEYFEAGRIFDIKDCPPFKRIVIPVDPSGASGPTDLKADAIGIVPVAEGTNGHFYVLEDLTGIFSPEQWGKIVRDSFDKWDADRVVGEKNFGGDMVRAVIQWGRKGYAYKEVHASRGKALRAEPVAALYERGLVHHVGRLPFLEEELLNFVNGSYLGENSPNRADAMVMGLTEIAGIAKGSFFKIGSVTKSEEYGGEPTAALNQGSSIPDTRISGWGSVAGNRWGNDSSEGY
jgi:hypothetical protein